MHEQFDVIIVGGGMVGAALSAALGQEGMRVALVEAGQAPAPVDDNHLDLRVSSLNLASQRLLESVGAWSLIPPARRCPFRHILAWDIHGHGETRFSAESIDLEDFGSFVENRVIRHALWTRLTDMPTVECLCETTPIAQLSGHDRVMLELDNGRLLAGSLLVGAEGASSGVRERAGIRLDVTDYQQRALIINVETTLPQQDISWQRFTPEGPQAMLPLPGHHASLVWYGDPDQTAAREALDDEALKDAVEREFPSRLGGIERVLGRASFPITRQHARQYTASRTVLVGDAAHVVHPLAGQGLNLGLQDVIALHERLRSARANDKDLGGLATIGRYALERRPQTLAMMAATETFHRVFTGGEGLRSAGSAALALAERLPQAKQWMMRRALGI